MSAPKYRPDIDGLRAIAILLVVLFHAGFGGFSGGFIGVDVFFVISGFLITSLIVDDLKNNRFCLSNFWERRIRRILPALTVMVFATLAAGTAIFFPDDFIGLGQQIKWQAITASNFYFLGQQGYFNTEHELQPLLHTWSLAVEEQYYILFPPLCLLVWRFAKDKLLALFWGGALLSLGLSIWMVESNPDKAFFLLPFRAWELLMGSLLVLYMPASALKMPSLKLCNAAGVAGLAMILSAGLLYTSKMAFPGLAALLPCAGAALLIWSGVTRKGWAYHILSHKIPVFIGLLSYSWYLWHWPVFSFAEYVLQKDFQTTARLVCIVVSFILAYLSWKFIETPFRRPDGVLKTRRAVFVTAFILLSLMAAAGFLIKAQKGFPERFSEEVYAYAQGKLDQNPLRRECDRNKFNRIALDDICQTNPESGKKPVFVLWGDSQGDAIAPAFITLSKKHNVNGYMAFKHGCPPILDVHHKQNDRGKPYCVDFNKAHFDFIERHKIKHVYMVANWSSWVRNKDLYFEETDWYADYKDRYENIMMAGVQRTVDELQKIGVTVHFLIDGPSMKFEPPRMLALESIMGVTDSKAYLPLEAYMKKRGQDIDNFVAQNKGTKLVIDDTMPLLCREDKCITGLDGRSLYFDHGHFSTYGANYLAPVFEPFFQSLK